MKNIELSKITNNYFYCLFHFHLYENIFDNDMFIEIYWYYNTEFKKWFNPGSNGKFSEEFDYLQFASFNLLKWF